MDIRQDPLYLDLKENGSSVAERFDKDGNSVGLYWVGDKCIFPLESEVRRRKAGIDERTWDQMRELDKSL